MVWQSKRTSGFTLLELIIVVTLIAVLAVVSIILLNPNAQIGKSWDAKRKQELDTLRKVFEDYYNDKSAYPTANDVCYPGTLTQTQGVCSCYICGSEYGSPTFSPYLSRLPCDPQSRAKQYLYQYECSTKQWYKLSANLSQVQVNGSNTYCVSSESIDCNSILPTGIATPTPTTSPSTPTPTNPAAPPTSTPTPTSTQPTPTSIICPPDNANKYCLKYDSILNQETCNNCGLFSNCTRTNPVPLPCDQPVQMYSDAGCQNPCHQ